MGFAFVMVVFHLDRNQVSFAVADPGSGNDIIAKFPDFIGITIEHYCLHAVIVI